MRKEKRKMMKYSYSSNKIVVEERIRKMIREVGRNDKKMENKEDRNER